MQSDWLITFFFFHMENPGILSIPGIQVYQVFYWNKSKITTKKNWWWLRLKEDRAIIHREMRFWVRCATYSLNTNLHIYKDRMQTISRERGGVTKMYLFPKRSQTWTKGKYTATVRKHHRKYEQASAVLKKSLLNVSVQCLESILWWKP